MVASQFPTFSSTMRQNTPDVILRAFSIGVARSRFLFSTAVMLLLLSGCALTLNDPATPASRILSAEEENELESFLVRAEEALTKDLLDPSQQSSATYLFRQALSLDPNNAKAERGLEQVVERYVALAMTAARQGDTDRAGGLLASSRLIDPEHMSIGPTSEFINAIDTSQRESVIIRGLSSLALTGAIDRLVRGTGTSCRYRISAANDGRARELYQLLRKAFVRNNVKRRPRATTEISTPERLERICTK